MGGLEKTLVGSPLKAPAIEIVDLLSDAGDSTHEPTVPAEEVLEEIQRPPGRGVIRIGDTAWSVRAPHQLVITDHRLPDAAQQRRVVWAGHAPLSRARGGAPAAGALETLLLPCA